MVRVEGRHEPRTRRERRQRGDPGRRAMSDVALRTSGALWIVAPSWIAVVDAAQTAARRGRGGAHP